MFPFLCGFNADGVYLIAACIIFIIGYEWGNDKGIRRGVIDYNYEVILKAKRSEVNQSAVIESANAIKDSYIILITGNAPWKSIKQERIIAFTKTKSFV